MAIVTNPSQTYKPIFIVRCPDNFTDDHMYDVHKHFYREHTLMEQYNVIIIKDKNRGGDLKFECYGSVYEEKDFLQLKQDILTRLK